ncbi:Protein-S-isoprenylcysteine O-methyltransferase [Nakaseomyces bracarensis]|uniref:Protein-S-isoprenylcysteine O-methyltransferase n=1 Tax=Nakaseomyces bracarensis TaxID=273131 RepID=A0ABR4NTV4_9SACH
MSDESSSSPTPSYESDADDLPIVIDGKAYPDIRKNPLDSIALTSFGLGILLGTFVGLLCYNGFKNFNIYIIALSLFHFLEFYITSRVNPGKVHSESFLLNNGIGYLAAHLFAITECIIETYYFPRAKRFNFTSLNQLISIIGFILILIGQVIRSLAMYQAGKSFSHILKTEKLKDHTLVTDGIYKYLRHPSYFGFFWWAVGTQMLLLNPIAFIVFVVVLWKFFNKRITIEEKYLVRFFDEQYLNYRKIVHVWIPFIQ